MDKELKKFSRAAALHTKINPKVADAIVMSLFKQMRETLESVDINDPESIRNFRIINFGIFYTSEEQIKSKQHALRTYQKAKI